MCDTVNPLRRNALATPTQGNTHAAMPSHAEITSHTAMPLHEGMTSHTAIPLHAAMTSHAGFGCYPLRFNKGDHQCNKLQPTRTFNWQNGWQTLLKVHVAQWESPDPSILYSKVIHQNRQNKPKKCWQPNYLDRAEVCRCPHNAHIQTTASLWISRTYSIQI